MSYKYSILAIRISIQSKSVVAIKGNIDYSIKFTIAYKRRSKMKFTDIISKQMFLQATQGNLERVNI